ncbi:MAG: DUF7379 domain-containing protein [Candidatus Thorarchaeota archaeon]
MVNGKPSRNVVLIIILVIPLLGVGLFNPTTEFSVWVVDSDSRDVSTDIAVRTLLDEVASAKLNIKETTLARLESVPLFIDLLVLVGHGQAEGLETPKALVPWSELYNDISERQPQKTIVLACNSPSDQSSNIVGFDSRVDAEAGAIIVGWYIQQTISKQSESVFPFDRVARAQSNMRHPLGRYMYFVNGYWGDDNQFSHMIENLDLYTDTFKFDYDIDNVRFFNYFDYYGADTEAEKNSVHQTHTISDFAYALYLEFLSLPRYSQVNIIAHSMGGIIVREMLRLYRTNLENIDRSFGKILTLGTPHGGTWLADPDNNWSEIFSLIGGILLTGHLWPSPVFWSMEPTNQLMTDLNSDPLAYSSGIDWYTISGFDLIYSILMFPIHADITSDPIVAFGKAHLSFAEQASFQVSHNVLIDDPAGTTYGYVTDWITEGVDSDGDGLTDDAEVYYHLTNPNHWDTDGDEIGDGIEVDMGLEPLDWDTDGDGIGDGNEVEWGYDPLDSSNPIPASQLISSVSYTSSTRYVRVYVNHFTNMHYVKFYVKYKSKYGWTGYYYMGTDYTPSSGKYYDSWTHPTGYFMMRVKVNAFDSSGRYIGTDEHQQSISDGGGGGGDPPEH